MAGTRLLERLEDSPRVPPVRRNDERLCKSLPDEYLVKKQFRALTTGEDVGKGASVPVRPFAVVLQTKRSACKQSAVQQARFLSKLFCRTGRVMQFRRIHQKVSYSCDAPPEGSSAVSPSRRP